MLALFCFILGLLGEMVRVCSRKKERHAFWACRLGKGFLSCDWAVVYDDGVI